MRLSMNWSWVNRVLQATLMVASAKRRVMNARSQLLRARCFALEWVLPRMEVKQAMKTAA